MAGVQESGRIMNLQKHPKWENEKYLKWVCTQLCVVCGGPGYEDNQIVPHHIKGIGHLSGIGLKAGDHWAMPMHVLCHNDWHNWTTGHGQLDEETRLDCQMEWVARTLAKAVEEGVLKVG